MTNKKEMTAHVVSVGADTEQSSQNLTDNEAQCSDKATKCQRRTTAEYSAPIPIGGKQATGGQRRSCHQLS